MDDNLLLQTFKRIDGKLDKLNEHHIAIEGRLGKIEATYKWLWVFMGLVISIHFI